MPETLYTKWNKELLWKIQRDYKKLEILYILKISGKNILFNPPDTCYLKYVENRKNQEILVYSDSTEQNIY